MTNERMITLRMPRSHWYQIVIDLEKFCGCHEGDIEILSQVREVNNGGSDDRHGEQTQP